MHQNFSLIRIIHHLPEFCIINQNHTSLIITIVSCIDSQLNMTTTAAATEKSRYIREIHDIREQLNRATVASERDQELKAKVFNDAKAEVITLNKKVSLFLATFSHLS